MLPASALRVISPPLPRAEPVNNVPALVLMLPLRLMMLIFPLFPLKPLNKKSAKLPVSMLPGAEIVILPPVLPPKAFRIPVVVLIAPLLVVRCNISPFHATRCVKISCCNVASRSGEGDRSSITCCRTRVQRPRTGIDIAEVAGYGNRMT
jgi:hypothetical protein